MNPADLAFGDAIRALVLAMTSSHAALRGCDENGASKAVIDLLRSDDEIGRCERLEIANLLSGQTGVEKHSRGKIIKPHWWKEIEIEIGHRKETALTSGRRRPMQMIFDDVAAWWNETHSDRPQISGHQISEYRRRSKNRK